MTPQAAFCRCSQMKQGENQEEVREAGCRSTQSANCFSSTPSCILQVFLERGGGGSLQQEHVLRQLLLLLLLLQYLHLFYFAHHRLCVTVPSSTVDGVGGVPCSTFLEVHDNVFGGGSVMLWWGVVVVRCEYQQSDTFGGGSMVVLCEQQCATFAGVGSEVVCWGHVVRIFPL